MMAGVSDVKRIFQEHGLAPKKWMGQNLLVDPNYLRKIVSASGIVPGEPVVEIGAGLGVLTEALSAAGALVWAIEVDSGFFRALEQKFADRSGIDLIHADALKFDFRALAQQIGRLRVVANLPYNVSSRLIFRFYEHSEVFSSLHILLQREVAERLTAQPGTRDYGVLTVLLGVSAKVHMMFDVPPAAFFPKPEVVSTFLRIAFLQPAPVPVADTPLFIRLVKSAFAGRRKTLRNTLRGAAIPGATWETISTAADLAGIDLGRRAETLSPEEFARFADTIREARGT
jgi:16S rRNA (adenine1518-N6/adenine1519-N6)-dimethyltransferase